MKKAIAIIIFTIIIVNLVGFTVFLKGNQQMPSANNSTSNSTGNLSNTMNASNLSNSSLELLTNNKSNTESNETG